MLAQRLPCPTRAGSGTEAGQRILVLAEEYPSGTYTWRRLAEKSDIRTVTRSPGQTWPEALLAAMTALDHEAEALAALGLAWGYSVPIRPGG